MQAKWRLSLGLYARTQVWVYKQARSPSDTSIYMLLSLGKVACLYARTHIRPYKSSDECHWACTPESRREVADSDWLSTFLAVSLVEFGVTNAAHVTGFGLSSCYLLLTYFFLFVWRLLWNQVDRFLGAKALRFLYFGVQSSEFKYFFLCNVHIFFRTYFWAATFVEFWAGWGRHVREC